MKRRSDPKKSGASLQRISGAVKEGGSGIPDNLGMREGRSLWRGGLGRSDHRSGEEQSPSKRAEKKKEKGATITAVKRWEGVIESPGRRIKGRGRKGKTVVNAPCKVKDHSGEKGLKRNGWR